MSLPRLALVTAACVFALVASVDAVSAQTPPTFTQHPSPITIPFGGKGQMTVQATGPGPLTYMWQWSWTGTEWYDATAPAAVFTGVTTPSVSIASIADDRKMRVVVTNPWGSTASNPAAITIAGTAFTISSQPKNATVAVGQPAQFSITATALSPPLTYQWFYSPVNVGSFTAWSTAQDGAMFSGVTTPSLTLNATNTSQNGYVFAVRLADGVGNPWWSDLASLTVTGAPTNPDLPVITGHPVSATIGWGGTATFTVTATGPGPLQYSWQTSASSTWAPVAGANSSSLRVSIGEGDRQFRAVVSNAAGSVVSNPATYTVIAPSVQIVQQPTSQTVAAGQTTHFTVAATGGSAIYYKWWANLPSGGRQEIANSPPYSGVGTPTLAIEPTGLALNGYAYNVDAIDATAGLAISQMAMLTVTASGPSPVIVNQPVNQSAAAGTATQFTVVASGTGPLLYQWQRSLDSVLFTNLVDNSEFTGTTTATLRLPYVNSTNADTGRRYRVLVSGPGGTTTSNSVSVSLLPSSIVFSTQPASRTAVAGQATEFTASATGGDAIVYRWQAELGTPNWVYLTDGVPYTGVNSGMLSISPVAASMNGYRFRLEAFDPVGGYAWSAPAMLSVVLPPTIASSPVSQSISLGQTVTLSVGATGTGPFTYQWYLGNAGTTARPIAGATSSTFTTPPLPGSARFWVRVSSPYAHADSSTALLTVPFVDQPLVAGVTVIKAIHLTQLRERTDAARLRVGLGGYVWGAGEPGNLVMAADVVQVRMAALAAFDAAGLPQPVFSEPALAQGDPIKALHINELRHAIEALEEAVALVP